MTSPPIEEELRGALRDELTSALRRLPELGRGELTFTALSGGITNRNFLVVGAPPTARASSCGSPATTRTCSASAARSSTPRP